MAEKKVKDQDLLRKQKERGEKKPRKNRTHNKNNSQELTEMKGPQQWQ